MDAQGPGTAGAGVRWEVWLDRLGEVSEQLAREAQAALGPGYTVERELGRGGMGIVLLARDLALDRPVAVKVLRHEFVSQAELRERFLREGRVAASFSHPHIVPVHAVIERPETLGYVMGYIDGETLSARVAREGPMLVSDAVRLLREVAWGLAYASGRGITHRDVKPDNILLERATGRALLTDFGIARAEQEAGLTGVGQLVGTPHYMSPEQSAGEVVDGRSDIYALGAVAWFALTGRPPFDAPTTPQILMLHMTQPVPSLAAQRPDLPQALVEIVERCLAKEPDARFPGGEAMVAALEPVAASRQGVPVMLRMATHRMRVASVFLLGALTIGPAIGLRMATHGAQVDGLVVLAFSLAMSAGIMLTMGQGMRGLAMAGYRHDDVRVALRTTEAEREELVAGLHRNAGITSRLRVRTRIAWALLGLGAFAAVAAAVRMALLRGGTDALLPVERAVMVLGAAFLALGLVFLATTPTRPSFARRGLVAFWAGAGGRAVFGLVTRGAPRPVARLSPDSAGSRRSAMTVFDALAPQVQRELRDIPARILGLEEEGDRLDARVAELRRTLEASREGPAASSADDSLEGTRRQLRQEVEAAIAAARTKRAGVTNALELVRLELLRLQAGVGDGAAVRRAAAYTT